MNNERKAVRMYNRLLTKWLRLVFTSWYHRAHWHQNLLKKCRRHFVVWRYFTKRQKEKRYLYQHCFWPIYVWRRYTRRMMKARAKGLFLSRIFNTYILIHIIRIYKHNVDECIYKIYL